jgi:hypothetical protein
MAFDSKVTGHEEWSHTCRKYECVRRNREARKKNGRSKKKVPTTNLGVPSFTQMATEEPGQLLAPLESCKIAGLIAIEASERSGHRQISCCERNPRGGLPIYRPSRTKT